MYEQPLEELDTLTKRSEEFNNLKESLNHAEEADQATEIPVEGGKDESEGVFLEKPVDLLNTEHSLNKIDRLIQNVNKVKVRNERANMRMKMLTALEAKKNAAKKAKIQPKKAVTIVRKKKLLPRFPKVVELENPKIPKELENMINYSKCEEKSGYLKIVRNPKALPNELQLYKIYVEMDLQNLHLFLDASGSRTLFNSIHLSEIKQLSQQKLLAPFNCFDFQLHNVDHKADTLLNGPVTLCAKDEDDMQQWIDSIQEFMQCRVDPNNPKHKQVIANYVKVNQLLKDRSGREGSGDGYSSLFYDNTNTITRNPKGLQQEKVVSKAFRKIFDTIQQGSIRRRQLQRKMSSRLQEARSVADDMAQRQEIVQQILQKRMQKEREKENNLLKAEEKKKQVQLLKAVQKKISSMEKNEITNFDKDFKKQIGDQQKKANDEAAKMMRSISAQNKFSNFNACTDTRILYFDDKEYVDALCKRYYGEHVIYLRF
jgi:hypothetical protein